MADMKHKPEAKNREQAVICIASAYINAPLEKKSNCHTSVSID